MGMVCAAQLSHSLGKCSEEVPKRIEALLRNLGLPVDFPELDSSAVIESMYHDKKTMDRKIKFILVTKIGSIEIADQILETELLKVL